ncbi:MAG TPA: MFS transporter [Bryobacteraceae bacterium]|nr:MFS transporter [Bryobacteraceae bacterium]
MLILAAILSILVYGVIAAMLGTVMPSFTASFHLSGEQDGNIALAQALGLVVASLAVGPLIDTRGKKTALIGGLTLITLSLAALPSATGYGSLMAIYFVLGLGGGIIVTGANALASDVDETRRASTLNFLNLFFGLGGLLTPFLAANLLNGDSAKLCYLGAGLGVVALLANIVAKIPPPTGERGFKMSEVGDIVGRPVLYLLALFLFLYVACEVGVWNWLASYLISRNIDKAKALNILSLGFALGLLLGRVVVSRILIRVSSVTVTLAAAILMAATTYLMLQSSDSTVAWIAVFCAGLAMAPVFPTTLAMVADAFPRGTATAMGIVITCGWLGLVVSSPIIGGIAGKDNAHLGTALLLLPAFSIAMVLVNLALRPMLAKK